MRTQLLHESFRNTVATWTGIGGRRQLLYVSADGLLVLRHDEDGWQLAKVFRLEDAYDTNFVSAIQTPSPWVVPEDFRRWIERWRGDHFRILVDSVDEEVEIEEMPRVRGSDRVKVLNRRLRQRFRDAALTTWIAPRRASASPWKRRARTGGAQPEANPGECTMMAALRQRNPMSLWIDAAIEAGARIGNIASPTLCAPAMLRALGPRPTALLVSVQPAGLRETLVQDGEIRFTRLLPVAAPAPWSQVASELERTVRFLMMSRASLRPLIQAGNFPVHLIVEGIDERGGASPIPGKLQLDGEIVVPIVRLDAAALHMPHVALRDEALLPGALGAVPALLGQRSVGRPGAYASPAIRRNWRSARSLASVWSLALLSLVAAVGANVLIGYVLKDTVDPTIERQRTLRIEALRVQAQDLERELAAMPLPAKDMQGIVELADQLQSRHVDAPLTLQLVAAGLGDDAALTINDVSWEPQRGLPPAAAGVPGATPARGAAPAPVQPDAAGATSNTIVRVAGVVDIALAKEIANRKVDELLARLRAACACEGKVLELPYNPSMDVAYANSLRKPLLDHPPRFTVELQRPSTAIEAQQQASPDPAAAAPAASRAPQAGGHKDA